MTMNFQGNRFLFHLFSLCLFFSLCLVPAAQARGMQDSACHIEISKANNNAPEHFRVRNKTPGYLTMTFLLPMARNVISKPELPQTWVFKPHSEQDLFTVFPKNPKMAWRYEYRYFWRNGRPDAAHNNSVRYRFPFQAGETFRVIQGFDGTFSHSGEFRFSIDWDMPSGTMVCAARSGLVVRVEDSFSGRGLTDNFRNRTNVILIEHEDGTIGEYSHFRKAGALVKPGQTVRTGQNLGYSGDVGYSDGPHLHFGVWRPLNGEKTESLPIMFTDGTHPFDELTEGHSYTAR